ncbi:MAG: cohesin domain-containing protein [bacterium]|nr:cohesin domain-containing protein [bacterium]
MEPYENQEPAKQNYFAFLWKNINTGQKFGIGALLLLLILFPIAVITVLLPTNPFSKAQFVPATGPNGAVSVLYFSKDATTTYTDNHTVSPGQTFPIGVILDSQTNTVTAAKIKIQYPTNVLDVAAVNLGTYLPTLLEDPVIDEAGGFVSFTIGSTANEPKLGVGTLATITFNATNLTPSAPITFTGESEVAAIEEDGNVLNFSRPIGIIVADAPTVTPTPTTAPNSADLQIKLNLDTVTAKANDLPLSVELIQVNCDPCTGTTRDIVATNDNTGTYTALFTGVPLNPGGNEFKVYIKPEGFLKRLLQTATLVSGTNIITGDPANPVVFTPGDINGNGEVDIFDFTTVVEDYDLPNSPADFNRSGLVDIFDFTSVVENFGKTGD